MYESPVVYDDAARKTMAERFRPWPPYARSGAVVLFSGDHILNVTTTVIDPPDGNMTAYMASLDRLDAICSERQIEFILPAHGYVLDRARDQIARLKAHRLARAREDSRIR